MRRALRLTAIVAVLALGIAPAVATPGNGNGPKPDYFVDEAELPFEALSGATAYWGVHKGAGYRIEVPDDWNGSLVMWAHGFRGTGLELTVDNHPLRNFLIPNGYAWALRVTPATTTTSPSACRTHMHSPPDSTVSSAGQIGPTSQALPWVGT